MSTFGWILWTIGIIGIYLGIVLSWKTDRQKVLMGWSLMAIGLIFNGFACIVEAKWIMTIISFGIAYVDYRIYKRKKKEFDVKELGIKEIFLRDLREYKFKLDRKNHKIV